jgi:hypothetical protein
METGLLLDSRDQEFTEPARWIRAKEIQIRTQAKEGAPGQFEVDAYRCVECGFLEMYAGGSR